MAKIIFTQRAEQDLTGEEKREVRMEMHRDGSLRGWHTTSSKKGIAWFVDKHSTKIGLIDEVAKW